MPKATPTTSATQSLTSALRLKLGWMSSMVPPNALAPTKTGNNPKRLVCGEGYEVHQLVASLRRGGRRLQGPEHRDGQGERHHYGEGDVEVLAHAIGLTALGAERKWKLSPLWFAVKVKDTQNQGVGGSDKGQRSGR